MEIMLSVILDEQGKKLPTFVCNDASSEMVHQKIVRSNAGRDL